MVYIRTVKFETSFDCCYAGIPQLGKYDRIATHRISYTKRFKFRPIISLKTWSDRAMNRIAKKNTEISCAELGINMIPCDLKHKVIELLEKYIPEEVFVSGVVFRILRMRNRGQYHIYGLTNKEFFDRMSKTAEKYTREESLGLLRLFKEGKVKTKAKV